MLIIRNSYIISYKNLYYKLLIISEWIIIALAKFGLLIDKGYRVVDCTMQSQTDQTRIALQ